MEQNRTLQLALDQIVSRRRDPWLLLDEALERIEQAGYVLLPAGQAA